MLPKKIVVGIFILLNTSEPAWGAAQVSIGGFASTNHKNLQTEEKTSLSAGIAFDIFSMVQIGYTLRSSTENTYGSLKTELQAPYNYIPFDDSDSVVKQSIDLTLVPFMTRTLVPFIFGGVAQQTYVIRRSYLSPTTNQVEERRLTIKPGDGDNPLFAPNGGIGVRIPLNQDFSIKVSQTWTKGVTQEPDQASKEAVDTYTEFSISYNL
jgi:hypothetical protein